MTPARRAIETVLSQSAAIAARIAIVFGIPEVLFPRLSFVFERFLSDFGLIAYNSEVTGSALTYGVAIAVLIGVATALIVSYIEWLRGPVEPLVVISQVLPKIAVVPLIISWLGFGLKSKIVITALIAFFRV
jgi:ABC-type nitrate/sulfonate/bicarbonate transport system permease component